MTLSNLMQALPSLLVPVTTLRNFMIAAVSSDAALWPG
jgi:hypothetical protein